MRTFLRSRESISSIELKLRQTDVPNQASSNNLSFFIVNPSRNSAIFANFIFEHDRNIVDSWFKFVQFIDGHKDICGLQSLWWQSIRWVLECIIPSHASWIPFCLTGYHYGVTSCEGCKVSLSSLHVSKCLTLLFLRGFSGAAFRNKLNTDVYAMANAWWSDWTEIDANIVDLRNVWLLEWVETVSKLFRAFTLSFELFRVGNEILRSSSGSMIAKCVPNKCFKITHLNSFLSQFIILAVRVLQLRDCRDVITGG